MFPPSRALKIFRATLLVGEQIVTSCSPNQSTESPIYMPLFGQKTGFRARMNEINRGFRALHELVMHLMYRSFRSCMFP
jgi:hypothetical protein